MGIRPEARHERLASASTSGIADGYAVRNRTRSEALAEVDQMFASYGVAADRHVLILSDALQSYSRGDDWKAPAVRELLTAAGASLDTARKIYAERFTSHVDWPLSANGSSQAIESPTRCRFALGSHSSMISVSERHPPGESLSHSLQMQGALVSGREPEQNRGADQKEAVLDAGERGR